MKKGKNKEKIIKICPYCLNNIGKQEEKIIKIKEEQKRKKELEKKKNIIKNYTLLVNKSYEYLDQEEPKICYFTEEDKEVDLKTKIVLEYKLIMIEEKKLKEGIEKLKKELNFLEPHIYYHATIIKVDGKEYLDDVYLKIEVEIEKMEKEKEEERK